MGPAWQWVHGAVKGSADEGGPPVSATVMGWARVKKCLDGPKGGERPNTRVYSFFFFSFSISNSNFQINSRFKFPNFVASLFSVYIFNLNLPI